MIELSKFKARKYLNIRGKNTHFKSNSRFFDIISKMYC